MRNVRRGVFLAAFFASLVVSASAQPPPNAALPQGPAATGHALVETTARLRTEIDAWSTTGKPNSPQDVTLDALYQQRI